MANGGGAKPNEPTSSTTGGGITDADIDALLAEMNRPPAAGPGAPAGPSAAGPAGPPAAEGDDADAIDALLASATFDDAPAVGPGAPAAPAFTGGNAAQSFQQPPPPANAVPLNLPDLQRAMGEAQASSIDLLRDVELNVKIELGRSRMLVEDVLKLAEGSVVELDKLAGDPVDVFVNDRLVARGEVLVLNDSFCVRVNEIVAGATDLA